MTINKSLALFEGCKYFFASFFLFFLFLKNLVIDAVEGERDIFVLFLQLGEWCGDHKNADCHHIILNQLIRTQFSLFKKPRGGGDAMVVIGGTVKYYRCGISIDKACTIQESHLEPSRNSSLVSLPSLFTSICENIFSTRFSGVSSSSGKSIRFPTML